VTDSVSPTVFPSPVELAKPRRRFGSLPTAGLRAGCATELFSSDSKFDSGTGWPNFTKPAAAANSELHRDRSLFLERIEVTCAAC
jgi:hypothetical protein